MNVWVIDIEIMNITNEKGGILISRGDDAIVEIRKIDIIFIWIPGIRPVKVPIRIPKRSAMSSSIIF